MSNDPTNIILDYMKSLRNSMMFGRCAGKTTRLSKLHQNRLVSELKRQNKIRSLSSIADFFLTINESILQLHDQGFEVENISEEVLQLMTEIKRWVSKTKQPYPSLEEDPFFYYLLLQNLETLQNAEREYQNIREVFLASKKIQNKSGGKPKRFRTNREMEQEKEFEHALWQLESLSEEISNIVK